MNTRLVTNGTFYRVQVETKENNWRDVTEGLEIVQTGSGFIFEDRNTAKRTLARFRRQLAKEESIRSSEWTTVEE